MLKSLHHKGYEGSIEISFEDKVFHGRVLQIKDMVTYEGESLSELEKAFEEAVDDYIECCSEEG